MSEAVREAAKRELRKLVGLSKDQPTPLQPEVKKSKLDFILGKRFVTKCSFFLLAQQDFYFQAMTIISKRKTMWTKLFATFGRQSQAPILHL
jgi:hypothetical protein